jgi:hypothetical protein
MGASAMGLDPEIVSGIKSFGKGVNKAQHLESMLGEASSSPKQAVGLVKKVASSTLGGSMSINEILSLASDIRKDVPQLGGLVG